MGKGVVKRLNLDMPEDMAAWVAFMAGMRDVSKISYVCEAIGKDMEAAPQEVKDAFEAFLKAREAI